MRPVPESPPRRVPQRRDERGRFMREPGPRIVRHPTFSCEVWRGPMRGGTAWEDGRAVLTTRYEALHGPIPPGHRLVRLCETGPRCVNPAHAVLLTPGQSMVYRFAGKEPFWLDQAEADEIHALVEGLAARFEISLGALIAYARWPHGLAELLPPEVDEPA